MLYRIDVAVQAICHQVNASKVMPVAKCHPGNAEHIWGMANLRYELAGHIIRLADGG